MGLIKIRFGPENAHDKFKKTWENINDNIERLIYIKNALSKFQREIYQNEIRQMIEIIKKLENIKIKEYNDDKIIGLLSKLKTLWKIVEWINSVREFLLFQVIYDNTKDNNQEIRFGNANDKLDEIKILFDKKLGENETHKEYKQIFYPTKKKQHIITKPNHLKKIITHQQNL